jgi:mRNA interferase MazF
VVARGEVWLVALDPTVGREIRKARPCLIVSPPELNAHPGTVLVAPMTTGSHSAPYRAPVRFQGKSGLVLLDQVRAVDKSRLAKRLGKAPESTTLASLGILRAMFTP